MEQILKSNLEIEWDKFEFIFVVPRISSKEIDLKLI